MNSSRKMLFFSIFIVMLPVMSIAGTELVNFYQSNVLLLITLPLIALVPVLVFFGKGIPEKLYPLVIVATAISLLFQTSLLSNYIVGADINQEYYFANLVKTSSHWNSASATDPYNAMLSVVILPPILSIVTGIDLTWIFKIIYPLIFSLVPLVLYLAFNKITNHKIAFLSVFYFTFVSTFFTEMTTLGRQEIAELFLSLLIFLIANSAIRGKKQAALLTFFGISLVISHYGTDYFFVFLLTTSLFILFLLRTTQMPHQKRTFSTLFVVLCLVVTSSWYIYVSNSAAFTSMVQLVSNIGGNLNNFLNPRTSEVLNLILSESQSPVHFLYKVFQIVMQFFIAVGIIDLVLSLKRKKPKFDLGLSSLTIVSFFVCIAAIGVPFLSGALDAARLFHLTLFFLAPFCVLGALSVFNFLFSTKNHLSKKRTVINTALFFKVFSIILAVFLLFNSGFVYEIFQDHPNSLSLSQNWINTKGTATDNFTFYSAVTPPDDVAGAKWLLQYRNSTWGVYSDFRARNNVLNSYAMISRYEGIPLLSWGIGNKLTLIQNNSYIYLRRANVLDEMMVGASSTYNVSDFISILPGKTNIIYSNGGTKIFYTSGPLVYNFTSSTP